MRFCFVSLALSDPREQSVQKNPVAFTDTLGDNNSIVPTVIKQAELMAQMEFDLQY